MKKNNVSKEEEVLKQEIEHLESKRIPQNPKEKSCQERIPIQKFHKNGIFELEEIQKVKKEKKKKKDEYERSGTPFSICFAFEDMNYQSLSPEEAEVKFNRWKDLMNSITHECEIAVTIINHNQDISKLKESIKYKDRNDAFDELRHEWNEMMENKILSGNTYLTKSRYFTLTIKEDNIRKAENVFNRMENEIVAAFSKIGVPARRMNTAERCRVLHDLYRPDFIGDFDPEFFSEKAMEERGENYKDLIAPDAFDFKPMEDKTGRSYLMGDKYVRCEFINEYPTLVSDRFLAELVNQQFTMVATVSIKPEAQELTIKKIKTQRLKINSEVMKQQKNAIKAGYSPELIPYETQQNKENADTMMDEVTNKNQKVFYVTITTWHVADSIEQLNEDAKSIRNIAGKFLCQYRVAQFLQEKCSYQTLPIGINVMPVSMPCTSEMTCAFIPFLAQELFQPDGLYYGLNKISNNLIYINRFNMMNANGFILGTSGSGKSFSAKREMAGMLLNTDTEVLVIDPDGEYAPFCEELGGQLIEISPTSPHHINPMDMDRDYGLDENGNWTDPIVKKADFIISLCTEIIGDDVVGIDPVQRAFIDRCISKVYEPYIKHNYDNAFIPTLKELQMVFDSSYTNDAEESIAKSFTLFTTGSLNIFSNKTNVKTNTRLTIYDISKLGTTMSSMGQLIMLDAVWNKVLENKKKGIITCLYSDEFTVLLRKEKSKVFFLDVFKRIRKLGGSSTGITQNITSLLRDADASEMLANSEFVYLLNQSAQDRVQLQKLFELSDVQMGYITDVDRGNGLIKAGRNIVPFKDEFPKGTRLYRAMTTDAKERKMIDLDKKELT